MWPPHDVTVALAHQLEEPLEVPTTCAQGEEISSVLCTKLISDNSSSSRLAEHGPPPPTDSHQELRSLRAVLEELKCKRSALEWPQSKESFNNSTGSSNIPFVCSEATCFQTQRYAAPERAGLGAVDGSQSTGNVPLTSGRFISTSLTASDLALKAPSHSNSLVEPNGLRRETLHTTEPAT